MKSKAERDINQRIADKISHEHLTHEFEKIIDRDLKKGRR